MDQSSSGSEQGKIRSSGVSESSQPNEPPFDEEFWYGRDAPKVYSEKPKARQLYLDRKMHDAFAWDPSPDAEDEPAVMWVTPVFDFASGSTTTPTVIYYDDRPLILGPSIQHGEHLLVEASSVDGGKVDQSVHFPSWKGCVFEVFRQALAKSPEIYLKKNLDSRSRQSRTQSQSSSVEVSPVSRYSICIKSPFLYLRLSQIVGYYPSFYEQSLGDLVDLSRTSSKDISSKFAISEPYGVLMHHFPQIAEFAARNTPAKTEGPFQNVEDEILKLQIKHVRHLYDFLKPIYDTRVLSAQRNLKKIPPCVAFDNLWYILKPGTDVYLHRSHPVHVCVVADVRSNVDIEENTMYGTARIGQIKLESWNVRLWYLDTDGTKISRVQTTCTIEAFTGLKEIMELEVCPVSVWDAHDNGQRRQSIMRRSKLLFKALQQGYLLAHYDGPVYGQRQARNPSVVVYNN
ncbi:MAG: hypothetical protein Q9214_001261 [Letrouitia sp. 1 TL-2023]